MLFYYFRRIDRARATAAEKKKVKCLPQQQEKHPHLERDETTENRKRYIKPDLSRSCTLIAHRQPKLSMRAESLILVVLYCIILKWL